MSKNETFAKIARVVSFEVVVIAVVDVDMDDENKLDSPLMPAAEVDASLSYQRQELPPAEVAGAREDEPENAIDDGDGRPPKSLEKVYLTMHYRKMQRDLNGPQKKKTKYHFIALACMLILVYGLSAYSNSQSGEEDVAIVLSLGQIILIGIWIFVSIVITAIFGGSKFIVLLYWMLVYWPLLAILASMLFHRDSQVFGSDDVWIGILLIIVEIITFLSFVVINYVYPKLVTSTWFRETYSASRFWNIQLIEHSIPVEGKTIFVMQYDGIWGCLSNRYYCRYIGEVNEEGLPHGQGVWSDDSYNGEVLTGTWKNGEPVAPFSSRQYGGKGNTFSAVQIAYFMATDDVPEANKMFPTNEEPPRCGVASVECSIAGDFMSHLPEASLVGEPQVEGADLTIGTCCRELDRGTLQSSSEMPTTSLQINSNDLRGVSIGGHLYAPTGMPFTRRIKQIIINVTRAGGAGYEEVLESDEEEGERVHARSTTGLRLEVMNWTRVEKKDALIFIPGFNSWLTHSLETFGQMMAMTKLSASVIPILYAFPGGQVATYRNASFISGSEKNRMNFLQLLKSLMSSGIKNIHIVTHSLGVQSLMAAFEDNADGSPSPVSQCFGPAPTHGNMHGSISDFGDRLVCKSMTMLNPDFPVKAFQERGFKSLRRVTSLITLVGDKADQALFWSSLINGICNSFGWSQPSMNDFEARKEEPGFHLQKPIGRNIESMFVEEGTDLGNVAIVLQREESFTPQSSKKKSRSSTKKIWLDCDVIDTTGLDTNVNDLRHSAYNVNSILLRDIEELIVTGKRASERTTLLHKKGNIFEYCHAPSFVKM